MTEQIEGVHVEIICGKCGKHFEDRVKFFYDTTDLPADRKLGKIECPTCGCIEYINIPQFPYYYFDAENSKLSILFNSNEFNTFEKLKLRADSTLAIIMQDLDFKNQELLRKAQKEYIEKEQFEGSIDCMVRRIRITPTPGITIEDKYTFLGKKRSYEMSKNEILYDSVGLSDFQCDFITRIQNKFGEDGFPISITQQENEQAPAVTCGLLSIVLTVGSVLIVPILVNIISDLIYDDLKRHKKENDKELTVTKTDTLNVSIYENNSNHVYHFEGPAEQVAATMKECGFTSLRTLTIKNTHTATMVDNLVLDPFIQHNLGRLPLSDMSKVYQKEFDSLSAVEMKSMDGCNEEMVCYKATLLMNKGDYQSAYWLLRPLINKATTIEFYYNLALCLTKLEKDDANLEVKLFTEAIRKYFQCPDLKDLVLFSGKHSRDELNKINQKFVNMGLLERDEDGNVIHTVPQSEEEIARTKEGSRFFGDYIKRLQNQDLNKLKEEAANNQIEALLYGKQREIEKINQREALLYRKQKENDEAIRQVMADISNAVMRDVEKMKAYRERNNISDEDFLLMMANGFDETTIQENDPNSNDVNDEKENYRKKLNLLLMIKNNLKENLEKVKKEKERLGIKDNGQE